MVCSQSLKYHSLSLSLFHVHKKDHKFIQEEALVCELYGIYLIENKRVAEGVEQLQIAVKKYQQWGALKKSLDVIDFASEVLNTNS